MSKHLLSLADLDAAAPGVLSVVFGPDGDFTNAPRWQPPIWDGCIHALFDCFEGDRGVGLLGLQYELPYERAALELRIQPSPPAFSPFCVASTSSVAPPAP